ncbi:hypothetical protein NFI96_003841 [Prochilodus magdalenae]|nr:hypothetical protein NFI96_003841 [Prochilodus magdalenae]
MKETALTSLEGGLVIRHRLVSPPQGPRDSARTVGAVDFHEVHTVQCVRLRWDIDGADYDGCKLQRKKEGKDEASCLLTRTGLARWHGSVPQGSAMTAVPIVPLELAPGLEVGSYRPMWETGVRFPFWVTTLCYTSKSPWARLLTLHWPTCNMATLDYREDGMDLGSDASSRSGSESNSNKVTPCSECKSSPSLELAALEDYEEEDEDYQQYKKRVIEDWESEYGADYADNRRPSEDGGAFRKVPNGRSLAEELQDVKGPSPPPTGQTTATRAAAVPEELKQNGNLILPNTHHLLSPSSSGGKGLAKPGQRSAGTGGGGGTGLGSCYRLGGYREESMVEESQLPTMDWAALERHLASLQFREPQENQNQGRTNSTNSRYSQGERDSTAQLQTEPGSFDRTALSGVKDSSSSPSTEPAFLTSLSSRPASLLLILPPQHTHSIKEDAGYHRLVEHQEEFPGRS